MKKEYLQATLWFYPEAIVAIANYLLYIIGEPGCKDSEVLRLVARVIDDYIKKGGSLEYSPQADEVAQVRRLLYEIRTGERLVFIHEAEA